MGPVMGILKVATEVAAEVLVVVLVVVVMMIMPAVVQLVVRIIALPEGAQAQRVLRPSFHYNSLI